MGKKFRKLVDVSQAQATRLIELRGTAIKLGLRPPSIPGLIDEALQIAFPYLKKRYGQKINTTSPYSEKRHAQS